MCFTELLTVNVTLSLGLKVLGYYLISANPAWICIPPQLDAGWLLIFLPFRCYSRHAAIFVNFFCFLCSCSLIWTSQRSFPSRHLSTEFAISCFLSTRLFRVWVIPYTQWSSPQDVHPLSDVYCIALLKDRSQLLIHAVYRVDCNGGGFWIWLPWSMLSQRYNFS